jgi:Glycosyltransferases involved in cell wall biogenesis
MSEKEAAFSVVIPTYNYAEFLPQAIDSVLAQTRRPVEIIVADDGSTDHTQEVAARYGDKIAYLRFDHQGVYAVRQELLGRIKGEWFLNLDADNWIEPDFLEESAKRIFSAKGDGELAFAYPDIVTFGDYEERIPAREFSIGHFKLGNFVDMNSVIRTDAARRVGFDAAFNDGWGDYDFFLSLAERGCAGIPQRASPLHYRVHSTSLTAATQVSDKKQRLMRRIIEKHPSFFTAEEARRAVAHFSPDAVLRGRICALFKARRFAAGVRALCNAMLRRPSAIFSFGVFKVALSTFLRKK